MTRLDDIKARVEDATEGPWRIILGSGENVCTAVAYESPLTGAVTPVADVLPDWIVNEYPTENRPDHRPDLNFIAHARADIPYLLDLVERAMPLVEMNTSPQNLVAQQWLEDVRGEQS
jgi:hypothetical protein